LLDCYIFARIVFAISGRLIEPVKKITRMSLTKRRLGIARYKRVLGKSIACRYHALEVQILTARGIKL